MTFHNPHLLWLLTLLAPMTAYYVWRTMQGGAAIRISTVAGVLHAPKTVRHYLRHLPFALRAAAFALLVVALARPQDIEQNVRTNTEGIDIVLAIDVSASMLARDFRPDRITAEAFTQSPLTTDQSTLQTLLARIRSGLIDDSGTAIGNGLATAINRLRESEAKSKVIILLTDGVNNRGQIAPMTAAEIARAQGIRVYTIGVGTEGTAPYPAVDIYGQPTGDVVMAKVEIDEKTLGAMADLTGGKYFRNQPVGKEQGGGHRAHLLPRAVPRVGTGGPRSPAARIPPLESRAETDSVKKRPLCSDSQIRNTSGCSQPSRRSSRSSGWRCATAAGGSPASAARRLSAN